MSTYACCSDGFVARFDNDGQTLGYSSYFGEALDEFIYGMFMDRYGNLFLCGSTNSPYPGNTDVLVFKLGVN